MSRFAVVNSLANAVSNFWHGEEILYYRQDRHEPYTYEALIDRSEQSLANEVADLTIPHAIVSINFTTDKAKGITPSEVDIDRDQIEFSLLVGEEPSRRQIVRILSTHANRVRLLVQ